MSPQLLDAARREGLRDEPPQPGVVGRVEEQQRLHADLIHVVADARAAGPVGGSVLGAARPLRVAQHRLAVGPAREDVLVELLDVCDRLLLPELVVERMRIPACLRITHRLEHVRGQCPLVPHAATLSLATAFRPYGMRHYPANFMGAVPEKPSLEGIEAKWRVRWEEDGIYRFDRTKTRDEIYAIDTPPPTVSGSLHIGHCASYSHKDLMARFWRMRGKEVFYPMGWDDNGLNVERRVQLMPRRAVRSVAALRPDLHADRPAAQEAGSGVAAQLHAHLRRGRRDARGEVPRVVVDPRPVGRLVAVVHDDRPQGDTRVAVRVLAPARARPRVPRRKGRRSGTST